MNKNSNSHSTLGLYVGGFGLSIILTLVAYWMVDQHVGSHHQYFSHQSIILVIAGLAIVQLVVQLLFFLHLGKESKPRLNLTAFLFMLIVLVVIVFGSLWIMNNLNYMGHSSNVETKIMRDEGIYR